MRERIRKMSKRSSLGLLLFGLLAVMIFSARIDKAWSYFTTFATAAGGYTVHLGDNTTVNEEFSNWQKHIAIKNEAGAKPVYIRARAYCGADYELTYSDESGKWTPASDGFYYYSDPVAGGETANELLVNIGNVPEEVESIKDFNVVVVYESIPVLYNEDGTPDPNNPQYWENQELDITTKSE